MRSSISSTSTINMGSKEGPQKEDKAINKKRAHMYFRIIILGLMLLILSSCHFLAMHPEIVEEFGEELEKDIIAEVNRLDA